MVKLVFNILFIGLWSMLIVVSYGFINEKQKDLSCLGLTVKTENANLFIDSDQMQKDLEHSVFAELPSLDLLKEDLKRIESGAKRNPYVESAEAFSNLKGCVTLKLEEREALLSIYNKHGEYFYLDRKGIKLPVKLGSAPFVLACNGFIEEGADNWGSKTINTQSDELLELANYIIANPFLKELITQIYINENREYELITRLGNHSVLLGSIDDLKIKMERLENFYRGSLKNGKINKYKKVDVRFKGQVVCS